ncbi:MAG: ribose-phosphate diphosphokinase [Spirochaetales bacterium]
MSQLRLDTLGIIACPGGEAFTDAIIKHLRQIYKKRFERKASILAQKYERTKEEISRDINYDEDLQSLKGVKKGDVETCRLPAFKVPAAYTRFPNGEFKVEILSSIRGKDLYIVQDVENHLPLQFVNSSETYELNVNEHFFCLMVTIDAAVQAGAGSITVVLPTYPYSRQHKKKGKPWLTAVRIGQILEFLGVKRIITLDIHSRDIYNGFRRLLLENLHASYQIMLKLSELIDLRDPNLVVVAPDTGAVERNKFFALSLGVPLSVLYKERDYSRFSVNAKDSNIVAMRLLGSVEGKTVFMVDDMLGTGSTLIKAMRVLKEMGAKQIICAVSIPLFTGNAVDYFEQAYQEGLFFRIIGTNAVRHDEKLLSKEWYISADVSKLFARIISRLHHNMSLSELLDNRQIIQKLLSRQKA